MRGKARSYPRDSEIVGLPRPSLGPLATPPPRPYSVHRLGVHRCLAAPAWVQHENGTSHSYGCKLCTLGGSFPVVLRARLPDFRPAHSSSRSRDTDI